jgi:hypothetical protein
MGLPQVTPDLFSFVQQIYKHINSCRKSFRARLYSELVIQYPAGLIPTAADCDPTGLRGRAGEDAADASSAGGGGDDPGRDDRQ